MECGECEMNVYAGHAPNCSRRCQAVDPEYRYGAVQCERGARHGGQHGIYDEDGEFVTHEWPARLGETVRESSDSGSRQ